MPLYLKSWDWRFIWCYATWLACWSPGTSPTNQLKEKITVDSSVFVSSDWLLIHHWLSRSSHLTGLEWLHCSWQFDIGSILCLFMFCRPREKEVAVGELDWGGDPSTTRWTPSCIWWPCIVGPCVRIFSFNEVTTESGSLLDIDDAVRFKAVMCEWISFWRIYIITYSTFEK